MSDMYIVIKKIVVAALLLGVFTVVVPVDAQAATIDVLSSCDANSEGKVCQGGGGGIFAMIKGIVNLLITVGGIIATIMIIVGGIRYSTSGGDPKGVSGGRDTIVYSVVGLVVSIMAFAIVNFVLNRL